MTLTANADLNWTLEDGRWKDSFDKLLEEKPILRERKVLKKKVRASFNIDSSIETSLNGSSFSKKIKRQKKTASTPLTRFRKQPFKCAISPIVIKTVTTLFGPAKAKSTRQLTHRSALQSTILDSGAAVVEYNSVDEKGNKSNKEDSFDIFLNQSKALEKIGQMLTHNPSKATLNARSNSRLNAASNKMPKRRNGSKKLQIEAKVDRNLDKCLPLRQTRRTRSQAKGSVDNEHVQELCSKENNFSKGTRLVSTQDNSEAKAQSPNNLTETAKSCSVNALEAIAVVLCSNENNVSKGPRLIPTQDNSEAKTEIPNNLTEMAKSCSEDALEAIAVVETNQKLAEKTAPTLRESTILLNAAPKPQSTNKAQQKTTQDADKTSFTGNNIAPICTEILTNRILNSAGMITVRKSRRRVKNLPELEVNANGNTPVEFANVANKSKDNTQIGDLYTINKQNLTEKTIHKISDDMVTVRKSQNSFKNMDFTLVNQRRSNRVVRQNSLALPKKIVELNESRRQTFQNDVEISSKNNFVNIINRISDESAKICNKECANDVRSGDVVLLSDVNNLEQSQQQTATRNSYRDRVQKSTSAIANSCLTIAIANENKQSSLVETTKSTEDLTHEIVNESRRTRNNRNSQPKLPEAISIFNVIAKNSTVTTTKARNQLRCSVQQSDQSNDVVLPMWTTNHRGNKNRNFGRALCPVQEIINEGEAEHKSSLEPKEYSTLTRKNVSDVELIEIDENNQRPSKALSIRNKRTKPKSQTSRCNSIVDESSKNFTMNLNIQPGKWRKSLSVLRRSHSQAQNQLSSHLYVPRLQSIGDEDENEKSVEFIKNLTFIGRRKTVFVKPENLTLTKDSEFSIDYKDRVLHYCDQIGPLNFDALYAKDKMPKCSKIGEGVYGEVFMKNVNEDLVVCKIIPIEGELLTNGEAQKTFEQILPEIVISKELCKLKTGTKCSTSGFVDVKKVACVEGKYPHHLIECWEKFDNEKTSENDHPKHFSQKQLFIVLELEFAGKDLEAFTFNNAEQSYAALQQIVMTLAVAEEAFEFEHRDLHWGNVLIRPTDETEVEYRLSGDRLTVPTKGIKATIIDYTLSRMKYDNRCYFTDLANDTDLFTAEGDYQFDIYRMMRDVLGSNWERFEPRTNVFWISYIISKMEKGVKYKNSRTKKHALHMREISSLKNKVLSFKNARSFAKYMLSTC